MAKEDKESDIKIQQLQLMEQSMQNFLAQKQQLQTHLIEIESALAELENSEKTYKIIGNIMVATKKEDLKKDLERKKENVELRINNIDKQEEKIKAKANQLQKDVLGAMEED
jgi:prefoldin beta subunit